MSRILLALALVPALCLNVHRDGVAAAETIHGVPLPPGSRDRTSASLFVSARSFRDTVEHIRRHLARHGLAHESIPIYRRASVTVARFLARQPGSPWNAIHVFSTAGRTYLFIVPARPDPRSTTTDPGRTP